MAIHFYARPYSLINDNFAESLSVTALTILTLFMIAAPDPLPTDIAAGVSVMCLVVAILFIYRLINARYERLARYLAAREIAENRVSQAQDPRRSEAGHVLKLTGSEPDLYQDMSSHPKAAPTASKALERAGF